MFDSHCHLHDRRIEDADELLRRARVAGVTGVLLAGVDPEGWEVERALAKAHPDVAIAFGVHPQRIDELDQSEADAMVRALEPALLSGEASAIGEIGLDGAADRRASMARQEAAFRAQLSIARAHNLPVVLHILDAHARALEILKRDGLPAAGGVLHSASASAELMADYLKLGLHISFAGPVTNPDAKKTRRAAAVIPLHRLLVETDAPFQTPLAYRPSQNEPAFLIAIVSALAQIRGESEDLIATKTEENARRLFGKK